MWRRCDDSMVSSEKVILPFAQTAKFYLGLIRWLLVLVQMRREVTPGEMRLDFDPLLLLLLFAIIELVIGIVALFPDSISWILVLLSAISSAYFVVDMPGLFAESLVSKPIILPKSFIGIISVLEILVLADKRVRDRYRIGSWNDSDKGGADVK